MYMSVIDYNLSPDVLFPDSNSAHHSDKEYYFVDFILSGLSDTTSDLT